MHNATSTPERASSGSGHQTGTVVKPSFGGRLLNRYFCSQSTKAKNP